MHQFRLTVRLKESGRDVLLDTADPTSFIRTLNAALAVCAYQPLEGWVIEHKNRAVASFAAGSKTFIDATTLERLGCPLSDVERTTFTLSEGFTLA